MKDKTMKDKTIWLVAMISLGIVVTPLPAQDEKPAADPAKRQVFFGEQHLHTVNSPDAFAMGTRNTPDDAYNFAKGVAVKKNTTGEMVQKKTPYDWCAVTDHAEYLGVMPMLLDPTSPLQQTPIGKMIASGDPKQGAAAFQTIITETSAGRVIPYLADREVMKSAWQRQKDAANRHYEPGKFTTLIAFEWTSIPYAQNLHHNVFFRDDKGPDMPFSAFDSVKREDLWTYQEVQRAMGHENISIAHNSNVSNSMMFPPRTTYGTPIDRQWAERNNANTVAAEIIQTKGASETHPALSPNDEFAEFESKFVHMLGSGGIMSKIDHSFIRSALIDGVGFQEMIGANPWKLGIVAGSDSHDGFSDNEENNYTGVHGNTDKTPRIRLTSGTTVAGEAPIMFGTPGATGVWADENTREGIFDALKRKESFGTSGPLIRVRFFGGWDYKKLANDKDWVKDAYAGGVPMGGDLPAKPEAAKAPMFVIWSLKDPQSGNLDRMQVIKGWYDNGYPREKIYDVAVSDGRKPDPKTGKIPPVGNTVDIKTAKYTNDIGDTQFSVLWTDPEFDPAVHAVYYVRVLEIPTPRWSTYDAVKLGVPIPEGTPATIQERAWSSPIWYTPDPKLVKKPDFYPGLQQLLP